MVSVTPFFVYAHSYILHLVLFIEGIFIIHAMLLALALFVALVQYCRQKHGKQVVRNISRHDSQIEQRDGELATAKLPEINGVVPENGQNDDVLINNGKLQRRRTSLTLEEDSGGSSSNRQGLSSRSIVCAGHGVSSRSIAGASFEQIESLEQTGSYEV